MTIKVSRQESPWAGYTGSASEEEAGFSVSAEDHLATLTVPPHLAQDLWQGQPLLAINTLHRRVVVNAAVFGPLERPDVTRLAPGQEVLVGIVRRPEAFAGYDALVDFLLRSQLLRSYWHLGATIGQIDASDSNDAYQARYCGLHEYWTSGRHQERYCFSVRIDKHLREIRVTGEALPQTELPDQDIFVRLASS